MKSTGILMSAEMMRAYFGGRKTVTRGLVKPQSLLDGKDEIVRRFPNQLGCPFGSPGDELWFREAWLETSCDCISSEGRRLEGCQLCHGDRREDVRYMADYEKDLASSAKWRPSIHMPKWASRAVVEILSIRVERIQDITEEEAKNEGIFRWEQTSSGEPVENECWAHYPHEPGLAGWATPIGAFRSLWNHLHGPGAWERNDYVWRIEWPRYEGVR